jgi:hypothetical protein
MSDLLKGDAFARTRKVAFSRRRRIKITGCSKMVRCKAQKKFKTEAYSLYARV